MKDKKNKDGNPEEISERVSYQLPEHVGTHLESDQEPTEPEEDEEDSLKDK